MAGEIENEAILAFNYVEVKAELSREGDRFTTFSGVVEWVVGWVVWMNRE